MVEMLRQMLGDDPGLSYTEAAPAMEPAEDTPHYLNPEVLGKSEYLSPAAPSGEASEARATEEPRQSATKMEEVLNQGMGFISGLLEMALGQKLTAAEGSEKMVTLDRETGEVTLKFTLPGFGGQKGKSRPDA